MRNVNARGIEPPESMRARVTTLLDALGDIEAARVLNVGRTTLSRIVGGLRVRRGTLALLEQSLGEIDRRAEKAGP